MLVLDNSDSMNGYDSSGVHKLSALKEATNSFSEKLTAVHNKNQTVIRTGAVTYATQTLLWYDFNWGLDHTDYVLHNMTLENGTSSTAALEWAAEKMEDEEHEHFDETGAEDIKKVVILMSDGGNQSTHRLGWKKCWLVRMEFDDVSNSYKCLAGNTVIEQIDVTPDASASQQLNELCAFLAQKGIQTTGGYDCYRFAVRAINTGTRAEVNVLSLVQCDKMKNDDFIIYSIAYGDKVLESNSARKFLQACATDLGYYIEAKNAEILDTEFKTIGASIIANDMRIAH